MATDGDAERSEDEMRPDEEAVLSERGEQLEEMSEEELLTVEEVAENLDIDLE